MATGPPGPASGGSQQGRPGKAPTTVGNMSTAPAAMPVDDLTHDDGHTAIFRP